MVKYDRITYKKADGSEGMRYRKNNLIVKESSVPREVIEKFVFTPTVEYDDAPERRRCVFCDAPQRRQRMYNLKPVDLCEWHYQNTSLGKIAQRVNELQAIEDAKPKEIVKPKKMKARKTALSNFV